MHPVTLSRISSFCQLSTFLGEGCVSRVRTVLASKPLAVANKSSSFYAASLTWTPLCSCVQGFCSISSQGLRENMSFHMTPTSSVVGSHGQNTTEDLIPSLHSAFNTLSPGHTPTSSHLAGEHHMLHERSKTGLEIILDHETIALKGTGPDVEPALLSGHVVLHLAEATSIKGITLSFRGKAKLPLPSHEP